MLDGMRGGDSRAFGGGGGRSGGIGLERLERGGVRVARISRGMLALMGRVEEQRGDMKEYGGKKMMAGYSRGKTKKRRETCQSGRELRYGTS